MSTTRRVPCSREARSTGSEIVKLRSNAVGPKVRFWSPEQFGQKTSRLGDIGRSQLRIGMVESTVKVASVTSTSVPGITPPTRMLRRSSAGGGGLGGGLKLLVLNSSPGPGPARVDHNGPR